MENPFSLKVGQVFTGFGIGCGIGIGIGRPLYLGAIPALQPVLSATRGATDVLSGVGRHFNNSLRKFGMKRIEAGIGCGVGIGHGFGVGIALKPGVVHRIQSSIAESIFKIMMNIGLAPNLSSVQSFIPGSIQSVTSTRNLQGFIGDPLDPPSKTIQRQQSTFRLSRSDGSIHGDAATNVFAQSGVSDAPLGSRTEKVISNFLQSPVFKDEAEAELDEVAQNLRTENNLLQVLLKHQEVIEKLVNENEKLRQILIEDLRVPPDKLQASGTKAGLKYHCTDCFECRRRSRKLRK